MSKTLKTPFIRPHEFIDIFLQEPRFIHYTDTRQYAENYRLSKIYKMQESYASSELEKQHQDQLQQQQQEQQQILGQQREVRTVSVWMYFLSQEYVPYKQFSHRLVLMLCFASYKNKGWR